MKPEFMKTSKAGLVGIIVPGNDLALDNPVQGLQMFPNRSLV